jgi:pimeloyl-ACP methyl ester carboxylesterase
VCAFRERFLRQSGREPVLPQKLSERSKLAAHEAPGVRVTAIPRLVATVRISVRIGSGNRARVAVGWISTQQFWRLRMSKNIVLVHGGFVDGSGWRGVYDILTRDGYTVSVVQNPTKSLNEDVAFTKRAIEGTSGDVTLVGHSYGGAVITQAGTHAGVSRLVYITAFAPDADESVGTLIAHPSPGAPVPPILPPQDGFLMLDKSKFAASFAGDVEAAEASFMANSQVPWGLDALNGVITDPAWKHKPAWYLHVTEDKMIPPAAQQFMAERAKATVVTTPGSHAVYVSNPDVVARIIKQAASAA